MKRAFSKSVRILVPLLVALAAPATSCFAWYGWGRDVFDGSTLYAWERTWHGPNALATPLGQYYIPRTPGFCNFDGYANEGGCPAGAVCNGNGALPFPKEAGVGFEPVQFERLGQVPNDLDVGTAAPSGPARK